MDTREIHPTPAVIFNIPGTPTRAEHAREQQRQASRDLSLREATLLLESALGAERHARDFEHWLDMVFESLESARARVAWCVEREDARWVEELVHDAPHLDAPLQRLHVQGRQLATRLERLTEHIGHLYGIVRERGFGPSKAGSATERVNGEIRQVLDDLRGYERELSSFLMDIYFCDIGCGD